MTTPRRDQQPQRSSQGGWKRVVLETHGPSVWGVVLVFASAVALVPAAIAIDRSTAQDLSWLVAFPVAALAWAIYSLVFTEERWRVVGTTADGHRQVLGSGEKAEVQALAADLERRLPRARTDEPPTGPSHRLVFLDLVRTVAVGLMIFAHFGDQLLAPVHRQTLFGQVYNLSRGFTAPLFFVVSGWSLAVAILPRFLSQGLAGVDFGRRLRRVGALLLWGYALVLPWWAPGFPFDAPAEVWKPFWTAGVLECLAAALALTLVLLALTRTPWPFLAACAAVAFGAVFLSPEVASRVAGWPEPVRGFFDRQGVPGGFPLTPWAGFFLVGVVLGGALVLARAQASTRIVVLLGATALAAAGQVAVTNPEHALVLLRLAVTFAALGFAALLTARAASEPRLLRYVSRHALTFYVAHMLLLWGVPSLFGLAARFPFQLGWLECAALTGVSIGLTSLLIEGAARVRQRLALDRAWVPLRTNGH